MHISIPYVITINLPIWSLVFLGGVLAMLLLGWKMKAYLTFAVAFVMAGFIQFPLVNQAIAEVSKLVK